ncbi:polysaccharide deacetylase family protein [Pontibacter sp. 172403-2]|uniref:polysaccharide deacetylase family protein n=1 Tax=Pontibacter rufus TaxID=2791028 RepID=UPI0018AF5633|nr:polysaccharide deacetylase family protein [Pontibacter sp. 172403-2]MBF9253915.1 polysaccharide deacetylase family protein [Pontibacter sp. 172403-2]
MKNRLRYLIKKYFERRAVVLMYHRVAVPEADMWKIAVSPENFEQHLQVLRKTKNVISLQDLVEDVRKGKIRKNSIALTFDDGYMDNFLVAKPLLEKYKLPATFFIASGNIGASAEFWWDELEQLILFTEHLPRHFALEINGNSIVSDLEQEAHLSESLRQLNSRWDACEEAPPSRRCALYYELWRCLKPLPEAIQQESLQRIRAWTGVPKSVRADCLSMTKAQLQELSRNKLFSVEAHTVSHPALAFHDRLYQADELLRNLQYLEETTGYRPSLLAYPYGNYNEETMALAAASGFTAAFTTEERPITKHALLYRLGRVQVKNCAAPAFTALINQWK